MSIEYVKRITVKKDGVYLCTKSNNDSAPYRSVRVETLSAIYDKKGQEGLDKELVRMFADYCMPKGNHKSVRPFRTIYESKRAISARMKYLDCLNAAYTSLSAKDKESRFTETRTPAMERYAAMQEEEMQKYMGVLYECLLSKRKEEEENERKAGSHFVLDI